GTLAILVVFHFPSQKLPVWQRGHERQVQSAPAQESPASAAEVAKPVLHAVGSFFRVKQISVTGVPPALEQQLSGALRQAEGGVGGLNIVDLFLRSHKLQSRFPSLSTVHLQWNWMSRSAEVEATLRKPLARIIRNGQTAGWLGDDGTWF